MFVTHHYLMSQSNVDVTVPFNAALGHLPMPTTLLVAPGYYKGYVYNPTTQSEFYCAMDFTQPGLYQIFIPENEGPNGSVGNIYNKIVASTPLALASAVATLHGYGTLDDALTPVQHATKMANSPLSIECGMSAALLVYLAKAAGYQARVTASLTIDPLNGYDDGHTHCEIQVNGKWVAFDASLNFTMQDASGNLLSVMDTVIGVWDGTTQFIPLAPFQSDIQNTVSGGWNQWGWCLANGFYDASVRAAFMPNIWRIPLIRDADGFYYGYIPPGAEAKQAIAIAAGYKILTKAAFVAKYY